MKLLIVFLSRFPSTPKPSSLFFLPVWKYLRNSGHGRKDMKKNGAALSGSNNISSSLADFRRQSLEKLSELLEQGLFETDSENRNYFSVQILFQFPLLLTWAAWSLVLQMGLIVCRTGISPLVSYFPLTLFFCFFLNKIQSYITLILYLINKSW